MKLLDLFFFKKKRKEWDKKLLEEYEKGKILQVDNDIDNKQHLLKKEDDRNQ